MSDFKLYKLVGAYLEVEEKLKDDPSLISALDIIKDEIEVKFDNIGKMISNSRADSQLRVSKINIHNEAIKKEYEYIEKNKKFEESLKKYMSSMLEKLDKRNLKTKDYTIYKTRKYKLKEGFDISLLPDDLKNERKEIVIDTNSLKKRLKNGEKIGDCILLEYDTLTVK